MPTVLTGADAYAKGQSRGKSIYPGTVQAIPFDTNVSPGANVAAQVLAADTIPLAWIPEGSKVVGYNIDMDDLDSGATLVMDLEYGDGTNIQTGLTTGQGGGKITDANAVATHVIGPGVTLTKAQSFVRFLVTTQSAGAPPGNGRISGVLFVMGR